MEAGQSRRFSPWPLIGILSVLIPVLVVAWLGWRSESAEQGDALTRLRSARPSEVAEVFFQALSDGRDDVAAHALAHDASGIASDDPSLRGLRYVGATESEATESRTTLVVRIVTARPWAGRAPGPKDLRVELEKRSGRWLVVSVRGPN